MALTIQRCQEVAEEVKAVCDDLKAAYYRAQRLLTTNSNLAIDWGAAELPAYLTESAPVNNLSGFEFTRQQVSNAIGSIDGLKTAFESNGVLGNLNQIASADPV